MTLPSPPEPYHEVAPHPALRPLVECYWFRRTARAAPGAPPLRVLPDGCMDVILRLGESPGRGPLRSVVGTMRRALVIPRRGAEDLMGVRFRPGAAPAFLDLEAEAVTDTTLALDDRWRDAATLWERLYPAPSSGARAAIMDQALLARLEPAARRLDRDVLRAFRRLDAGDAASVAALLEEAPVGRRQLERRFLAAVGLSPGDALRVARFRRAVAFISARPGWTLGRIAAEAGFHDQPHLNREFRSLGGLSPGAWRRERDERAHVASVQDGSPARR